MSETEEKPKWYSIKEAAGYLEVGEPTIYRWMRDGKITFRKVGDSTRFLKEDLDAVIQVHPSERDVQKVQQVCPVCHHDELIEGRVESTGRSYFRPDHVRFWTLKDVNIKTNARMCTRCGALAWFGDLDRLVEIRADLKEQQRREEAGETAKEG